MGRRALLLLPLLLCACVSGELGDYREARREYVACVERHPAEACEAEKLLASRLFEVYEQAAQAQWGCRSTPDRCRTPR
jgi:hypothetical protein